MADHNIYAIFIMLLIFLESVDGSCQKHKCFTGHGQCVDTEKYLQADYVCACKKGYTGLYCLGKMPSCRRTCKKPLIKECIGLTDNTAVCICPKSRKPQLYGTEPHICFTEKALPNRQKICKRRRNKCDSGQQCVNYAQAPEHLLVVCQCPAGQRRGKMCKEEYAPADAGQGPCVDTGTAGTVCLCNKYGEEPGFCKPKPPSQKMTSSLGIVTEKETPKVASVSYRHRLVAATSNNGNEAVADIVSNEQKVNSGSYQSSVKQYDTSQTVRPPPKQSSTRKYIPTYKDKPNTLEDKEIDKIHDNLPQDKRISIPTDSDKPLSDTSVIPNADTETFTGTNPCYPNPCQNGGKCKSMPSNDGGYECDCPISFRGKFCHEVTQKCSVLGCDETKDCISLTCICVLNGVNSICLTDDNINPSEYNKMFNAISKSNKTGAETALIVVACIVVFLVIGIVHCSRVNTRRSTMQSTYQTAVRKGLTIDPVPGWCDVSSSVFKQTLCCKGDIVDTYKPKKEPKEKKSRKKKKDKDGKKKEEEGVLPDAIDSEINKRRQSNTGLHPNTNQSGNLSGNNTQNWKFSHRLLANKLLRKHSFADDDKLLLLEKNEKQKMSARYDRKMKKDFELKYLSKLSKHTKKNPNVLQMYKGSGDVHVKKNKSKQSVKLAGSTDFSGLKHSNSAKFRYNSERKQYVEKWLESDINGACESYSENNELHTQHRIGELKKPRKSSRKSCDMVQPEGTMTRQSEHLQDDVPLLYNTTNYNEPAESIENEEMYYIEDDQVDTLDRQKELMNTSLNNSNVNTNIGEQLFYVSQSPTYNMYSDTMKCGYSEDDMCYNYDHQSMHDYVTDHQIEEPPQHDHLKIIVDSPTGDITDAGLKNVQDDGDDISNGAVISQQLLCSCESEVRNVYKSPDRELYGVWSTIVELPETSEHSEQIEAHQTAVKKYDDRNNSQQETVQNLSPTGQLALSPTGQLDVSTDRHYLKSFVQNGQKLYYVDTDSQVNINQNHEMTNYSDTVMPCQNNTEDKFEQTDVDNELSDIQRIDIGYDVDQGENDRELGVIPNQVDGWYHEDDFDIPDDQQDYVIERELDGVNCEQYSERLPQYVEHDQDSYCQQNLSDDRYTSEYYGDLTESDGSLQNEHIDSDQNVIHMVNDGVSEQSNSVTHSQNIAEYMYDNNNSGVHIDVDGESDNKHDAKQSKKEHNGYEHFGEQSQSGNDKESYDIPTGNNSMFIENCCEIQSQIDPIDSASGDSVDYFTSDISTLVPSATESEDYLSEDITLIAPDGTEV